MANSQAEKLRNHKKIIDIASKRLREVGLEGLSIAGLMAEAGLTNGAFYKHFESRDAFVAEAIDWALQEAVRARASAKSASQVNRTLRSVVDGFLSERHRDDIETACAVSALVSDVARANDEVRSLYTEQVKRNFADLGELVDKSVPDERRRAAIVAFSAMAGALGLARAVSDKHLSREILDAVREFVLAEFSRPSPGKGRK
ncbi:TetR/AcrR family transcriptional regulator [Bradyrhizobium erythrophlei]|uniref:TetR/AcrR family transcriptional regulator n=1 Tax=Bradyrhizobium erythrophlei TaxID=1437360 RepID=UPI0035EBC742